MLERILLVDMRKTNYCHTEKTEYQRKVSKRSLGYRRNIKVAPNEV